ncbi:hypothetical protein CAC42_4687 [Sphaceloma murrayae]|uniref:Uncharacterized protein n=1 Tax=Sphaceloma murrayae TaxID=2082308 RepID=A0A2K1QPC5_9PEZI|nr:hypothetical protein CAC42_4687 [Sphaceloma murrayae]
MPCEVKGHVHTWPREGTLYISKCERICQFCFEKTGETKLWQYAWFVRRHVRAVHADEYPNLVVSEDWLDPATGLVITPSRRRTMTGSPATASPKKRVSPEKTTTPVKRARTRRAKKEDTPETEASLSLFETDTEDDSDAEGGIKDNENNKHDSINDYEVHDNDKENQKHDSIDDQQIRDDDNDSNHESDKTDETNANLAAMAAPEDIAFPTSEDEVPSDADVRLSTEIAFSYTDDDAMPAFVQPSFDGDNQLVVYNHNANNNNRDIRYTRNIRNNSNRAGTLPIDAATQLAFLRQDLINVGIDPDNISHDTVVPRDHNYDGEQGNNPFATANPAMHIPVAPFETNEEAIARHNAMIPIKQAFTRGLQDLYDHGASLGLSRFEMGVLFAEKTDSVLSGNDQPRPVMAPTFQPAQPFTGFAIADIPYMASQHHYLSIPLLEQPFTPQNTPLPSPPLEATADDSDDLLDLLLGPDIGTTPPPTYNDAINDVNGPSVALIDAIMSGRHDGNLTHLAGLTDGLYGDTQALRANALVSSLNGTFTAENLDRFSPAMYMRLVGADEEGGAGEGEAEAGGMGE